MRDRLIALIRSIPNMEPQCRGRAQGKTYLTAAHIADHLLANGVIVPPCKVGDKVYIIDEDDTTECDELCVVEVVVLMLYIGKHGIAVDLSLPLGFRLNIMAMVGKNVFLTREEAEKALRERSAE